jgi:hypothetical protein
VTLREATVMRFFAVAMLVFFAPRGVEASDAMTQHRQCRLRHGLACLGFASSDIPVLEKPELGARSLGRRGRGNLLLLGDAVGDAAPEWLRVVDYVSSADESVFGWVKRDTVVTAADLHLVVGCWPVRLLSFRQGDSEGFPVSYVLRFDVNGLVRANKREHIGASVYYAPKPGVFVLAFPSRRASDQAFAGALYWLDYEKRKISAPAEDDFGVEPGRYEFAKDSEMVGCRSVPIVKGQRTLARAIVGR